MIRTLLRRKVRYALTGFVLAGSALIWLLGFAAVGVTMLLVGMVAVAAQFVRDSRLAKLLWAQAHPCAAEYREFLAWSRSVGQAQLPAVDNPLVSVLIRSNGDELLLSRTLMALEWSADPVMPIEVITFRIGPYAENLGRCRGRFIVLLEAGAVPLKGWLGALIQAFDDPSVVGVCSRLLDKNGRYLAAGGFFDEGAAVLYVPGLNETCSFGASPRDVEFGQRNGLMVRAEDRRILEFGSDEKAWRDLRGKIRYVPTSTVIQGRFNAESGQVRSCHDGLARSLRKRPTILIVDEIVPAPDRDSGSVRMWALIEIMQRSGYGVVFMSVIGPLREPYAARLRQMDVEVVSGTELHAIERAARLADVVWLCRPNVALIVLEKIRSTTSAPIVYDTIDLHFVRMKRQSESTGQGSDGEWQAMKEVEIGVAREVSATTVVTPVEQQVLQSEGVENAWVVPNIHSSTTSRIPAFDERSGILFIGSYHHAPNVDAVKILCESIMPLVWRQAPEMKVTLLGSDPNDEVLALAGQNVIVPGWVEDVSPFFGSARVFVAPLRFGAGMKGKIGQAMAFGLPVVTTTIGAEGMDLDRGEICRIADGADDFARALLDVYQSGAQWERFSKAGLGHVAAYSPEQVARVVQDLLSSLVGRGAE